MTQLALADRIAELRAARTPFVVATVVNAERPTSVVPGDSALVHADGTVEGFVGGVCAESSLRAQALDCLVRAESVVLRITPDPEAAGADPVGRVTVANPCLSGGTLEIFLEPSIPAPLVLTVGAGPIAQALRRAGAALGFDVRLGDELGAIPADTEAVVVASHGRGEEEALLAALGAEVPYVGLVASPRRGAAVVGALGGCGGRAALIHTPAGLDIGARRPDEVALSILAEIVASRPRSASGAVGASEGAGGASPASAAAATDPVCAMSVAMVPASLSVDHDGATYWFCGPGCRDAFVADPGRYAVSV